MKWKATLIAFTWLCCGQVSCRKGGKATLNGILNPDPDAFGSEARAEFNQGYFEGDIVGQRNNGNDRNAAKHIDKLWPRGVVPYAIDDSTGAAVRAKVEAAISDFHYYTCIKFVPRNDEHDYVFINSKKKGCFAHMGRSGGGQPLNLENTGCQAKGTVIHEMLHTIGFGHEQSRNDRDKFITIHWNNIDEKLHGQFSKMAEENNQGMGYDFASVMHYPDWGFSINDKKTITTIDPRYQKYIGQRAGFSAQDVEEVKKLYKCNGKESGVEGTNGCMDDRDWCERALKWQSSMEAACQTGLFAGKCPTTCGKC